MGFPSTTSSRRVVATCSSPCPSFSFSPNHPTSFNCPKKIILIFCGWRSNERELIKLSRVHISQLSRREPPTDTANTWDSVIRAVFIRTFVNKLVAYLQGSGRGGGAAVEREDGFLSVSALGRKAHWECFKFNLIIFFRFTASLPDIINLLDL